MTKTRKSRSLYPAITTIPKSIVLTNDEILASQFQSTFSRYNNETNKAFYDTIGSCFTKFSRSLVAYKKILTPDRNGVVAVLEIPFNTDIYMTGSKCRARCAYVTDVLEIRKDPITGYWKVKSVANRDTEYMSTYTDKFKYKIGELVKPKNGFSTDFSQCNAGIHFFMNIEDAIKY